MYGKQSLRIGSVRFLDLAGNGEETSGINGFCSRQLSSQPESLSRSTPPDTTPAMVLQSNFAKRVVSNVENHPPSTTTKSIASRLRTSITDAARRRRARANGTSTSKYNAVQAKRRSAKTPASNIKFRMATIPNVPPPVVDVEMRDAEPSGSSSATGNTPVVLPKELGRPDYRDVSREALVAADPELHDTDVTFLREALQEIGPDMLRGLAAITATPSKNALPNELNMIVHDLAVVLPSHLLAIYGPILKSNPEQKRKITLYPVHSLILSAYCTRLPPFPASIPLPALPTDAPPRSAPFSHTIPVRPLCLPHPASYLRLAAFLYTKRTDILMASLMPPCPLPAGFDASDRRQVEAYATQLATTFTGHALLQHAMIVHGLWQNVCALSIFDDSLWETMDAAWNVLLCAIAVSTGNKEAMMPTEEAEDSSSS
ncbi:hypothetical protein Hypma_001286 [Hypsizygus marmoreus]|uniref:Clp1-like protein n=1 Tax=Hypsizygus marmoreus TaxID=39966 RepID=A0A369K0C3_HYPMA|nr:hypothetical protein Hypma_001286 [Hypsizygus marmoreus]